MYEKKKIGLVAIVIINCNLYVGTTMYDMTLFTLFGQIVY